MLHEAIKKYLRGREKKMHIHMNGYTCASEPFLCMTYEIAPGCFWLGATLQATQKPRVPFSVEKYLHCALLLHNAKHSVGVLLSCLNNRSGFLNGHILPSYVGALLNSTALVMTYEIAPACFWLGATLQAMQKPRVSFSVVKYLHCLFFVHKAAHSVGVLFSCLNNRSLLWNGHL